MLRIRPRERAEHRRPDDPQVAGEDDGVGRGAGEGLRDGVVGAARDHGRVDPLLRGPVDRRAGPVGEDEHDLPAELAARRRRVERPQVRAAARDPDRDPASSRVTTGSPPRPASGW